MVAFMPFLVAIVAILGSFYYKLEKEKIKANGLTSGEKQLFLEIKNENERLRERLSNVEYIVTNLDDKLLPPDSGSENRLGEMKKRLKS